MPKEYFIKCQDCGYLWTGQDESPIDSAASFSASFKCRHCGSQNGRIVSQQPGRFGCVGNPPQP